MELEQELREQICEIGKRIYDRGMVAANDGNISVQMSENVFLCTPTGISKGFMTPDCICKVDQSGTLIEENGTYKPSSELKMHMRVYEKRPDIKAVVHAHPLYATAYAVAGIPLDQPIIAEAVLMLGTVPVAPYASLSTMEVPDSITPFLPDHDAVLLANHGALTYSDSLLSAYYKMESLEHYAHLSYLSKELGARNIPEAEVERIVALRPKFGLDTRAK